MKKPNFLRKGGILMESIVIQGYTWCDFCNAVCPDLSICNVVACRDFCVVVGEDENHTQIMSEHDVITLGLGPRSFASAGDWLACPICSDLILDSRWDLVSERAIRSTGYLDKPDEPGVRKLLSACYSVIRRGMEVQKDFA
jgi:hypothetical protein